jgi:hypothetical protein
VNSSVGGSNDIFGGQVYIDGCGLCDHPVWMVVGHAENKMYEQLCSNIIRNETFAISELEHMSGNILSWCVACITAVLLVISLNHYHMSQ